MLPAHRAFTLIELLVAVAIAALLLAAGAPAFYGWLNAYELANHAHHLAETMHAGTPQIEESRESLGLFIVAAWMLVVATFGRGPATRVIS